MQKNVSISSIVGRADLFSSTILNISLIILKCSLSAIALSNLEK